MLGNSPSHLNSLEGKGRGVFASHTIQRQTIVEISPVLLFSSEEYDLHGKYTILDQYTFKWTDGRLALALGLGSLFNHSETPNISYTLDPSTDSIRYVTVRDIEPDEELCIFYGHNLWFRPVESLTSIGPAAMPQEDEDEWGGLSALDEVTGPAERYTPFQDGDPDEIIPDDDLPLVRFKPPPEEETMESVMTMILVQAWVVDIFDPRQITGMLKWLKQVGLESQNLGHLKRIRKKNGGATLLLTTSLYPPTLPEDFDLPEPYKLLVPISAALTPKSLNLKSTFWPTVYAPPRKGEAEDWSRGKIHWAWEIVQQILEAADDAKSRGELPIVAHIPALHKKNNEDQAPVSFTACDTRRSTTHPLRHAVINVIRRVADQRAQANISPPQALLDGPPVALTDYEDTQNGVNYLLTSLTLFTTHEPCIMCSMALIHSRVKEVIYIYPMAKTGGCGSVACLPILKGVNHRFGIHRWKLPGDISTSRHGIDDSIDA
ncbi:cytidine deaminase-like protein [Collybia nuda]|uniref:Cytidine deaminase-like protein n=1 Tax=Collybia nuda TaxID=64659 RepID=A0A9P6CJA1_9AGAR|nr:cytidine deaminase-like protein [Collybia nuda]